MSSGTSLEQMLGVYKWVVDDVTKTVREEFLNEGVDSQVLEDLKQLWENKLVQSGALSRPEPPPPQPTRRPQEMHSQPKDHHLHVPPLQQQAHSQSTAPNQQSQTLGKVGSSSVIQQATSKGSPSVISSSKSSPSLATTASPASTARTSQPPPLIDASQLQMIQHLQQARSLQLQQQQQQLQQQQQQQQAGSSLPAASQPGATAATTSSTNVPSSTPSVTTNGSLPQPRTVPTPTAQTQTSATTATGMGVLPQSAAALYSAMTGGVQQLMMPNSAAAAAAAVAAAGGMPLIPQTGIQYAPVQTPNGIFYLPIALGSLQQAVSTAASLTAQQQQQQEQQQPQQQQQQQQQRPSSETQESGRASIEQSDGPRPPITSSQSHSQATPGTPEHRPMKRKLGLRIVQLDGPAEGSSSEDSDEGSSDSEVDDLDVVDDDDDPLNSDDDADSDEGDDAVWETDNTIVCQFEKVYRVRTKWKFALKDGIMNLGGHDYIFTKVTGEADW